MWILYFGIMIIGSLIQYMLINNNLENKKNPSNTNLDYIPIIYVVLSLGVLYLQFNK